MDTNHLQAFFFKDFSSSFIPHILKEVYIDQVYARFLNGKKDLTIVDWGGNLGLTSYYFKDFAKQVYCVEPARQHLECIEAMINQNKIKNIKMCRYAISNENGTTNFYHNDNVTMFSLNDAVNKKDDFEEVETVTVEEFIKRESIDHIDLLKWDTEGNEGQIVTSDAFKRVAPKIDVIVGEWHTWGSMSPQLFCNAFRDLGFEFNWLNKTEASVYTAIKL